MSDEIQNCSWLIRCSGVPADNVYGTFVFYGPPY